MSTDRRDPKDLTPGHDELDEVCKELSPSTVCIFNYRDESGSLCDCVHSRCEKCHYMLTDLRQKVEPQETQDLERLLDEFSRKDS